MNDNGIQALQSCQLVCPWCWQVQELLLDCSQGDLVTTEDCAICCHPMQISLTIEQGLARVRAERGQ